MYSLETLPLKRNERTYFSVNHKRLEILKHDLDSFLLDQDYMLSKEFAIFLRCYIYLLAQKYTHIVVLHEGADDVFVVGSVEDILAFSEEFAHTYRIYTNNCMTISAGISIYSIGNKFISAANEAQELMNVSKAVPGKNAIAAFFSDSVTKWGNFSSSECLRQLSSKEH